MSKRLRRCSIRARTGIAAAALAAALPAVAAAAMAPADVSSLASRILSDSRYQSELPRDVEPLFRVPSFAVSPFVRSLIIVVVILAAGLLIAWIANRLMGGPEGAGAEEAGRGGKAGARRAAPGGDPSRLAAEGRYDEAVHALLLVALGHLLREADHEPRPSTTVREILQTLPLPEERRRALARLIRHVEVSLFGGRAVGPEGYARCLESFRLLVPAGAA